MPFGILECKKMELVPGTGKSTVRYSKQSAVFSIAHTTKQQ